MMLRPMNVWEAARDEAAPGLASTVAERTKKHAVKTGQFEFQRRTRPVPQSLATHWFKAMHNAAEGTK